MTLENSFANAIAKVICKIFGWWTEEKEKQT